MSDRDMRIDDVISKQEIYELSVRYMRGLDRLDIDLLRSVFHDDASVNYGFFKGPAPKFADFCYGALKDHLANHHMIGQVLIELDGERATGEVYFQAFHRIVVDGEERDLFIAGRYVDRYERRDGVWKISFRAEVNDWSTTNPATDGFFAATPATLRGGRMDDWSYRREELERA